MFAISGSLLYPGFFVEKFICIGIVHVIIIQPLAPSLVQSSVRTARQTRLLNSSPIGRVELRGAGS